MARALVGSLLLVAASRAEKFLCDSLDGPTDCFCKPRWGADCLGNLHRAKVTHIIELNLSSFAYMDCTRSVMKLTTVRVNGTELVVGSASDVGRLATFVWEPRGRLRQLTGAEDPFYILDRETTRLGERLYPAFVDWDNDGDEDLVIGTDMATAVMYFSHEAGGHFVQRTGSANPFEFLQDEPGADHCRHASPAFGDWDGDGDLDLVMTEYCSLSHTTIVLYYEQLPHGQLVLRRGAESPFQLIRRHGDRFFLELHDVDGDGDLDLLVGIRDQSVAYYERVAPDLLLERVGEDHPFYSLKRHMSHSTEGCHDFFLPKRVYGSEAVDYLVPVNAGLLAIKVSVVHTLERQLAPGLNPFYHVPGRPVGSMCWSIPEFVDWDRDGLTDLILGMFCIPGEGYFSLFYRRTSRFSMELLPDDKNPIQQIAAGLLLTESEVDRIAAVTVQDIDGDGEPELIVALALGNPVVWKNVSNASYTGWIALKGEDNPLKDLDFVDEDEEGETGCRALFVDWDGDGALDVITTSIVLERPLRFYKRTGPTSLKKLEGSASPVARIEGQSATLVDWDLDGRTDLVVGHPRGFDLYLRQADGSLVRVNPAISPFAVFDDVQTPFVAFTDWDGDGDLDAVVGTEHGHVLYASHSGCGQSAACALNGICDRTTGACTCKAGYAGPTCATCKPHYFTRTWPPDEFHRWCDPCRGTYLADQVCCNRGACFDDRAARRLLAKNGGSTTQLMLAKGDGHCDCLNPSFGIDCCTGTCPGGFEEAIQTVLMNDRKEAESIQIDCLMCEPGTFKKAPPPEPPAFEPSGVLPESKRPKCAKCPPGAHAAVAGSTGCMDCPVGRFAEDDGSSECKSCPPGRTSGDGQGACRECAAGTFAAEEGVAECRRCGLLEVANKDRTACARDAELLFWLAFVMVAHVVGWTALLVRAGRRTRIADVARVGQKVFVTTVVAHGLRPGARPTPFLVRGSGLPALDGEWVHATADDATRLCVRLDPKKHYPLHLDSSMGDLRPRWWHQFFRFNVLGTPLPASVLALFTLPVAGVVRLRITNPQFLAARGALDINDMLSVFKGCILTAVLVASLHAGVVRWHGAVVRTPLQIAVADYRQANARYAARRRGPERGLQLESLLRFESALADHIRDRTCQFVSSNLVRLATEPWRCSLAELVGPTRMAFFVSHFAGMSFQKFMRALERHAVTVDLTDRGGYWVHGLSTSAWQLAAEGGSDGDWGRWQDASWYKALTCGSCVNTCVLIDIEVVPLTRSWCLLEVLQTYEMMPSCLCRGVVFCAPTGLIGSGQSYDIEVTLAKRLERLSITNARSEKYADYRAISEILLRSGGRLELVRRIREDLLQAAEGAADKFVTLLEQCREPPAAAEEVLSDAEYEDQGQVLQEDEDGMCSGGSALMGPFRSALFTEDARPSAGGWATEGLESVGPRGLAG